MCQKFEIRNFYSSFTKHNELNIDWKGCLTMKSKWDKSSLCLWKRESGDTVLEARNSEAGNQEAQRKVRGGWSRLREGQPHKNWHINVLDKNTQCLELSVLYYILSISTVYCTRYGNDMKNSRCIVGEHVLFRFADLEAQLSATRQQEVSLWRPSGGPLVL